MSETIGQQLHRVRLEQGLTLEQVELATRIRTYYLKALEEDDYLALPSMVQGRGFLRAYASYLGLDAIKPLEALENEPAKSQAQKQDLSSENNNRVPETSVTNKIPTQENTQSSTQNSTPPVAPAPEIKQQNPPPFVKGNSGSRAIFLEIGSQLSQRRELLGLSLADVERYTHLRSHYLEALESGNIDNLPSPVQGRGMLSNYARFLNLDPEALLLRFADGLQTRRTERMGNRPFRRPATQVSNSQLVLRQFISVDLVVGALLVILLVGFVVWGASQILTFQKQGVVNYTIPPVSELLLSTGTQSPSMVSTGENLSGSTVPTAGTSQPTLPVLAQGTLNFTPLPSGNEPIQVYIIAHLTAWVQVTADGKVVFQGRVQAGSAYPYAGNKEVEVITGDAAAIQVFYNQVDLGSLGSIGQVMDLIFSTQGLITPTPTTIPTATLTPLVSSTASVTPTTSGTPIQTASPTSSSLPSPTLIMTQNLSSTP